jgi:Cu/Ag efflux protein CusF
MSRAFLSAIVVGCLGYAPSLWAQASNVVTRESTVKATVDRIERATRVVSVRAEGNQFLSVYVDPAIKAFDDLRVGDVVTIRYVESAIVQVRPRAKLSDLQDTTEDARKTGHEKVIQQLKATVKIENVDPQGLTVTFRTADGRQMMRPVTDKQLLEGIRPGDQVEVTLTRERAISIEHGRR